MTNQESGVRSQESSRPRDGADAIRVFTASESERPTSNSQLPTSKSRIPLVGRWVLDVGRWALNEEAGERGPTRKERIPKCSGQALVIVLSLLSVLILVATCFLVLMRNERLSSDSLVGRVRAEQLVHAALVYAMNGIDFTCTNRAYPYWEPDTPNALGSGASSNQPVAICSFAYPSVSNEIPASLWADAFSVTSYWWYAGISNTLTHEITTNGRIAILIVNCSGLLDANTAGGTNRTSGVNARGLDLSCLPDLSNTNALNLFYADRTRHRRYETLPELAAMNSGLNRSITNFFIYSYDPGRDVYFTNANELGTRNITLLDKFNPNSITNYSTGFGSSNYNAYASDMLSSNFLDNYWIPATNILHNAGFSNNAAAVCWNMINYLDPDKVPQSDSIAPWQDEYACEAIPLINEIVLQEYTNGVGSNQYEFVIELWYPFGPNDVEPSDNFYLQVAVFTNEVSGVGTNLNMTNVLNNLPEWTSIHSIPLMSYNASNEFLVFTSPTNDTRITFTDSPPAGTHPISATRPLWLLARVVQSGTTNVPVDQAPDLEPMKFTAVDAYSVDDPRVNGSTSYWTNAGNTIGTTNSNCSAWTGYGQGLPIYHADALMASIGEIGHVSISSTNDPYWSNINLMDRDGGTALLDWMTVRNGNSPTQGLVHIGTSNTNVLYALFHNVTLGVTNAAVTNVPVLNPAGITNLVQSIANGPWHSPERGPYINFQHLFDANPDGGPIGQDMADCIPSGLRTNDWMREAPIRGIVNMLTFRQNIFTIFVTAQSLAKDARTVTAERRAVAVIFRDSYTGKFFTRSFRWLQDE